MAEPVIAEMQATAAPLAVAPPPKPRPKMLGESRFALSSYATNRWSVTLEAAVPYDRVFEPDFWSHVARKMRIGDIIDLHSEDTSFYAELYVVAAHRLAAKVVELRRVSLAPAVQVSAGDSPMTVKFRGPHARYCIMRGGEVVKDKFQTEEEAIVAMADYRKAFAA